MNVIPIRSNIIGEDVAICPQTDYTRGVFFRVHAILLNQKTKREVDEDTGTVEKEHYLYRIVPINNSKFKYTLISFDKFIVEKNEEYIFEGYANYTEGNSYLVIRTIKIP